MRLRLMGEDMFPVEVKNISGHGIGILASAGALFPPYEDFPWFKDVPVAKILHVEEPAPGHYYWPILDGDLSAAIIAHPDRFPLTPK